MSPEKVSLMPHCAVFKIASLFKLNMNYSGYRGYGSWNGCISHPLHGVCVFMGYAETNYYIVIALLGESSFD